MSPIVKVFGPRRSGLCPFRAKGLNRSRGRGAAASGMAVPAMDGTMGASYLTMRGQKHVPRMIVQHVIARSITDGVASIPTRRHLHRGQFRITEPNGRCSHDREWCIRRVRNNSAGRCHAEIFVRPMRYKGCHQAHNAKVVICALFTTRNSLKLQGRRKVFFTHSQCSCHIANVVLTLWHDSRQIPIASDASPRHTSRGFLHWRFADAGPPCAPRHHHGAGIRKPSQ